MRIAQAIGVLSVAALAACAIHPLPEDVSGYSTAAIVEQIRCEARSAVLDHIKRNHPRIYKDGSIGYDFTFTITENNNASVDAALQLPFTSGFGKFSSTIGVGKDRQRQSERKFAMAERFTDLTGPSAKVRCPANGIRENWAYPITGRIGLAEIVRTYAELEDYSTRLDNFSDQLMFTTTLDASLGPKVDLNPLVGTLRLTQVSGAFVADRKDIHKVRIVLVASGEPKFRAVGGDSKARALEEIDRLRRQELRIIQ